MLDTDFGGIHYDSRDKVEEDVVAVCPNTGVAKGHLQLIHSLQQKTFSLILKVFKGSFLVVYTDSFNVFVTVNIRLSLGYTLNNL